MDSRSSVHSRIVRPDETSRSSPEPRTAVSLDAWLQLSWTEGCQIDDLPCLQSMSVTTRNSVYEIIVTSPQTGSVKVRGGRFFPDWSEAVLAGCSMGGSFLKVRGVYAGFCMELYFEGQTVVTTRVRTIALHRDPPNSSH